MIKTYQVYAGLTFLGYEYAYDEADAQIKTYKKFGAPKLWGVDHYITNKISWGE